MDKAEEQAEARQQTGDADQQSQATAVKQEVKEAAPKEDLEDTLSVLQGAETDLQEQQSSQVHAVHLLDLQQCSLYLRTAEHKSTDKSARVTVQEVVIQVLGGCLRMVRAHRQTCCHWEVTCSCDSSGSMCTLSA